MSTAAMTVVFDGAVSSFQRRGGITRYFQQLFNHLQGEVEPVLVLRDKMESPLAQAPGVTVARYKELSVFGTRFQRWLEPIYRKSFLKRHSADLSHPTYYHLLDGRKFRDVGGPLVITVYDFTSRLFPNAFSFAAADAAAQDEAIKRADAIICISESTRRDLLTFYPETASRSFVTHLAASLDDPETGLREGNDAPFFLFVGDRAPYKNFHIALRALAQLEHSDKEAKLVVVGPPATEAELGLIANLKLEERVEFTGHMDDAALTLLYRESVALVYPSAYEGFGLPVLEAMRCRTAVIACDCSSIPEVAGDAAILVPPSDPEPIADAMATLLHSTELRKGLVERGMIQADRFSWQETARATAQIYRSLVDETVE